MRILASLAFCLACTPSFAADYNIRVWSYTGDLQERKVIDALLDAASILSRNDQPDDVACPTSFNLVSDVFDGSTDALPKALASREDMDAFANDGRFSIYVVRTIEMCGNAVADTSLGQRIGGCTRLNGGPLVISIGSLRGNIFGHEMGHAQGLDDNYQSRGLLMYYTALRSSLRVTQPHCDRFAEGQMVPIFEDGVGNDQDRVTFAESDAGEVANSSSDIELEELLGGYWHQVPLPAVSALTEEDLTSVREVLKGEPSADWQNAVTILGLRGDADDANLLDDVVQKSAGIPETEIVNGDVPWLEIQGNAQLALGLLYNRTNDPQTLGLIYGQMVAPEQAYAESAADTVTLNDLSRNATKAFQLAGAGAAEVYPEALLQAEVSTLLRNGAVSPDAPIQSLALTSRWSEISDQFNVGDTVEEALQRLDSDRSIVVPAGFKPPISFADLVPGVSVEPGPITGGEIRDFFDNLDPASVVNWNDVLTNQLVD